MKVTGERRKHSMASCGHSFYLSVSPAIFSPISVLYVIPLASRTIDYCPSDVNVPFPRSDSLSHCSWNITFALSSGAWRCFKSFTFVSTLSERSHIFIHDGDSCKCQFNLSRFLFHTHFHFLSITSETIHRASHWKSLKQGRGFLDLIEQILAVW